MIFSGYMVTAEQFGKSVYLFACLRIKEENIDKCRVAFQTMKRVETMNISIYRFHLAIYLSP